MIKRLLISLVANGLGLYLAATYVSGVSIPLDFQGFAIVVVALSLINFFIRPFIKFILTPVIILTLGLGIIIVNAIALYVLELLLVTVSIDGIRALSFSALILTVINLVVHFSAKKLKD